MEKIEIRCLTKIDLLIFNSLINLFNFVYEVEAQ